MIMTVAELKKHIATDAEDQALEAKLQGSELLIRAYTNNNFQVRAVRCEADVTGGLFIAAAHPFHVGDTVQVTDSALNEGLYTVKSVTDSTFTVNESGLREEIDVLCTLVEYPEDVKMGVANMLKWELDRRDKVGLASETISRHTTTFIDLTGENASMGYPKALIDFLFPYMRARFGRGIGV